MAKQEDISLENALEIVLERKKAFDRLKIGLKNPKSKVSSLMCKVRNKPKHDPFGSLTPRLKPMSGGSTGLVKKK